MSEWQLNPNKLREEADRLLSIVESREKSRVGAVPSLAAVAVLYSLANALEEIPSPTNPADNG